MYDVLVDLTPLDTYSRYSGTGRYVRELARAIAALDPADRGGLHIGGLTSIDDATATTELGWQGHEPPRITVDQEVPWLMARRTRLPLTLRRHRPRLLHATYHMGTPRGSGVPRLVTCLDLLRLVLHHDYMPGRWIYRHVLRAAEAVRFHSARRIVAISQHTADDLVRLLGVPASKIDVTLLGVDLDRYRPFDSPEDRRAAEAIRAKYELVEGGYVFHAGAHDPRKNIDTFVAAFAEAQISDLELVLIGNMRPSDEQALARALDAAGRPDRVRCLGFVPEEDLPAVMAGALGFVFCSTYEGFGAVAVEAMACGCPVIHTGLTSMSETMGDAGLVVPPRDVAATAAAIRRLANEGPLRQQLTRAGLARAARFSWRNTALATVESYRQALR